MVYADTSEAYDKLGWKAKKTLKDMCEDAWRWQMKNPNGF
jgi:UDP-glucose 4-epimerase